MDDRASEPTLKRCPACVGVLRVVALVLVTLGALHTGAHQASAERRIIAGHFPPTGGTISTAALGGVRIGDTPNQIEKIWGGPSVSYRKLSMITNGYPVGDIVAAWGSRVKSGDCYAEVTFERNKAANINVSLCRRFVTEKGETYGTPFGAVEAHWSNGSAISSLAWVVPSGTQGYSLVLSGLRSGGSQPWLGEAMLIADQHIDCAFLLTHCSVRSQIASARTYQEPHATAITDAAHVLCVQGWNAYVAAHPSVALIVAGSAGATVHPIANSPSCQIEFWADRTHKTAIWFAGLGTNLSQPPFAWREQVVATSIDYQTAQSEVVNRNGTISLTTCSSTNERGC
jgi:hypothetical protein